MKKCANLKKDVSGKECCGATEYATCKENCAFYISVSDAKASRDSSDARLNTLSDMDQGVISEKYYNGKMPWKK